LCVERARRRLAVTDGNDGGDVELRGDGLGERQCSEEFGGGHAAAKRADGALARRPR